MRIVTKEFIKEHAYKEFGIGEMVKALDGHCPLQPGKHYRVVQFTEPNLFKGPAIMRVEGIHYDLDTINFINANELDLWQLNGWKYPAEG